MHNQLQDFLTHNKPSNRNRLIGFKDRASIDPIRLEQLEKRIRTDLELLKQVEDPIDLSDPNTYNESTLSKLNKLHERLSETVKQVNDLMNPSAEPAQPSKPASSHPSFADHSRTLLSEGVEPSAPSSATRQVPGRGGDEPSSATRNVFGMAAAKPSTARRPNQAVQGPTFEANEVKKGEDPLNHPANKNANPIEKLLHLQAVAARDAKKAGKRPGIAVRIEHDDQLRPTHITVKVAPDADPRQVTGLKEALGLDPSSSLESKTYDIAYPDRVAPTRSNEPPEMLRVPVAVVSPVEIAARAFEMAWKTDGHWGAPSRESQSAPIQVAVLNGTFVSVYEIAGHLGEPGGHLAELAAKINVNVPDAEGKARLMNMVRVLQALENSLPTDDPHHAIIDLSIHKVRDIFKDGAAVSQADLAFAWTILSDAIVHGQSQDHLVLSHVRDLNVETSAPPADAAPESEAPATQRQDNKAVHE
jgi:hypothetical protein